MELEGWGHSRRGQNSNQTTQLHQVILTEEEELGKTWVGVISNKYFGFVPNFK